MLRLTGPLKFRSFWPRTTWQWSPNPHTRPIWPPVTFSSSPSWSFGWSVEHSAPLKRFKRNHSGYLTHFQKGTSRDASKHGGNAGTAVFVQKGSTLKVIEEFNIQGKQTSFYKYCPGTFGYTLLYLFIDCIFWTEHTSLSKLELSCIIIITNYYYMYFIVKNHSVLCLLLSNDKFYIHFSGSLE